MEREAALKMLKEKVTNQNLLKHMYAAEAVMKGLAQHFGEDEKLWGLAGLLHDIDYDETKDDLTRHSLVAGRILKEAGFPEELIHAVICHNDTHGEERKSLMDKALYATDPVTGLIVAGALIRPEKKLAAVDVPFLLNRYHEKSLPGERGGKLSPVVRKWAYPWRSSWGLPLPRCRTFTVNWDFDEANRLCKVLKLHIFTCPKQE